ncbi:hypothetical protein Pan241w_44060 [Gimesia alba]|uniref:Uncharacterized protein n=1 Tax=Gimesia alba TaxID=2527973 RepID=A0A517RK90_9PLAN|nr:hypothetical protein Pan241w_44060 [Gimesia alba]
MLVLFFYSLWWICFSLVAETPGRCLSHVAALFATEEDLRDRHHLVKSNERHLKIRNGLNLCRNWSKLCRLCRCLSQKTCAQTAHVTNDFSQNTRQTSGFYSADFDRENHFEVLKKVFSRARRRNGVSLLACPRQGQFVQLNDQSEFRKE